VHKNIYVIFLLHVQIKSGPESRGQVVGVDREVEEALEEGRKVWGHFSEEPESGEVSFQEYK